MNDTGLLASTLAHAFPVDAVPDWHAAARRAALERFLAEGLPKSRLEEWKYTSLDHLEGAALHPPATAGQENVCVDVTAYPGHVLSFDNGQLACHGTWLSSQLAGTLGHLGDTRPVREHLGRLTGGTVLASLNLALWRDGARVYVPRGERLGIPVFAVHAASEADAMLHPRTLAVLEEGSQAVLVEHFLGNTPHAYWQNAVTEIVLEQGASLVHVRVVEEGEAATHTGLTSVRMGRDSQYSVLHVDLAGRLARHDMVVELVAPGAVARVDALEIAQGRRHADLHLRLDHQARQTSSRITWRGMADARGHAIFDGHVVVGRAAHQTDARQSCRGLLLSPHAEVDAMPRLEIYADDVKCGHGASIGNLDAEALFYLRSRGIEPPEARRLLLEGFAGEALGLLQDTHLGDWLMPRLLPALAGGAGKAMPR
jgi:Fe-S cluster assembly protein SufD